jgi:pimeloyl-ACP methyl ester carboxylesterase
MSRRFVLITFPFILILAVYFLGPTPKEPVFSKVMPVVPLQADELEFYISQNEKQHPVKPNNEARIIWNDSLKKKTEYAVVYLHGFSASQMEGDPIHRQFAKQFGCNLYLSRLADHGLDTVETLLQFTADRFWNSAKEALAIGKALGDKVIVMSTSTGSTVALMLAAYFPDDVYALINLSPNIALRDPAAFLLNDPWGLQIARLVMGSNYREWDGSEERLKYWNNKYRLESLVQVEELVEQSMTSELFAQVEQPSLTLYYYKNDEEQDSEVKVSAMLEMNEQLATPDSLKVAVAMPNTGAHVIGSPLASKDVEGVHKQIEGFAKEKLMMKSFN